mmetsp:Transcript_26995/g.50440  ORF Transcript_26995/g.50440 Transcript_26995/m.50440 type:complete len:682 (+) Transcript_26995:155-2200(+)
MTSLLRDLALEMEDFSEHQEQQTVAVSESTTDIDYEDKYNCLLSKYEQLEATHHKTVGEVSVLKDTIDTLREDYEESKRHIERQKEQNSEFQEVEETCADLREECEKHLLALTELQACHTDLENSLSETNGRLHTLQMEKKNLQDNIKSKDNTIARLEKELCDVDKAKLSRSQSEPATLSPATPQSPSRNDGNNDSPSQTNPNELSLEDQVDDLKECVRRSSSRLSYLNTRLAAKDEMILKLQNRIEEVITERDSFREALQMSFVNQDSSASNTTSAPLVSRSTSDSAISSSKSSEFSDSTPLHSLPHNETDEIPNSAEKNPPTPPPSPETVQDLSGGENETKSSPPSTTAVHSQVPSQMKPSLQVNSKLSPSTSPSSSQSPTNAALGLGGAVLGNWQNTIAVSSVADGLKGVTSSLGSYLYAPGTGGGVAGGVSTTGLSIHHKNYITSLEKKLQAMIQKNKKLSELKALIPVVEELKDKVQEAEQSSKDTDKWADEEFSTLSKKMDDLRELRKEAVTKFQNSQLEVENLKQQISRTANTYANFEDKLQEKVRHIQMLEKKLKEISNNSVDLTVHEELQDKIQALTGESKHWQQKAQSLSKEMHRSMTVQMDYNKKKDEILRLEKKIEELEVERLSFKEAMQEAMLDKMHMEQNSISSPGKVEPSRGQEFNVSPFVKSWFG